MESGLSILTFAIGFLYVVSTYPLAGYDIPITLGVIYVISRSN